ncbi:PIN domain-containing protein [Neorhizobium sp. T7_12]|jgi:predicted nucleic acid-binding protein|uniref:PIN domain-containing protein n=1 Tax=Neorhizobium sp. T7_12 TaxID=2093832 RepID=UPI000CF89DE2|nr:PIN domain-containing protein [Neorhizobium sp. T7_12]
MAVFLDTNILLYSVSRDPAENRKRSIAQEYLGRSDCVLSIQVLQEFYVQATRSSRAHPLSHELAVNFIETWLHFKVIENTTAVLKAALEVRERTKFSFWDSMVVAAAFVGECDELVSEDLSHRQQIDRLTIINPFL